MIEEAGIGRLTQLHAALRSPFTLAGRDERLSALRVLEDIKNLASALQVQITNDELVEHHDRLADDKRAKLGVAERLCASDVGQARRESPWKARRLVGLARTLCTQLPCTFAAMKTGALSEYRASLVATATMHLSEADRIALDAEIAPHFNELGDKDLGKKANAIAYRLDPAAFLERHAKAVADRNVTVRPAPEGMAYLTGLLPMATAVACYAALKKHADTAVATGDPDRPDHADQPRSHGQIMADELTRRLTHGAIIGHHHNGAPVRREPTADQPTADLTIEFAVIMSDETLLNDGDEPADIVGYGPIPARAARQLFLSGPPTVRDRLRRLYTRPGSQQLIAMESRARLFPDYLKRFIRYRDRTCRTPWCGAPIKHIDHIEPAHQGGPTTAANARGLCAQCNFIEALRKLHGGPALVPRVVDAIHPRREWPAIQWSA